MKYIIAFLSATVICASAHAQAPATATTASQGTAVTPATKGDVKAAANVEKAEIKAQEKI